MKIKKFLPILVVLLVLFAAFTMMTVSASADEATPSEGLKYELNYKYQYYTVKGIGDFAGTELVIPSTYNGLPVRRIAAKAFYQNKTITKVVIPESITVFGNSCFQECTALQDIVLPQNMTYIPNYMFAYCPNLGDVVLPDSVTDIKPGAFRASTFKSFTFPANVTRIAGNAFRGCTGFVDLVIPDTVTTLGDGAFRQLAESTKTITVGSGVTSLATGMFFNCRGVTTVTLPEGLTSIGSQCFEQSIRINTINFPSTLKEIKSRAFYDVRYLKNIVLPEGCTTIGGNAFNKMTRLETLVLPSTITNIGNNNGANSPAFVNAFYAGSEADFAKVTTGSITAMKKILRYYTEEQPMENEGNYWHYVDGVPTIWDAYVAPPVEEPSDYTLSDDGTYYIVTGSTIELAGATNLVLPATYKDLPVKAIAANAFAGNTTLKSIVIGASVVVENGAFDGSAVADIYFVGAAEAWNCVTTATVYFYSETQPTVEGNFWSYVDGEIVLWAPAGDDDGIELPSVGI